MLIRKINDNDLENLLSLYEHLHESDVKASKENLTKTWNAIISNKDFFIYLVAEIDGKIVATCNITIIPNLTRGGRPIGLLENVVTHKDYRRMGIGRQLIERALEIANERRCYKVMLMTNIKRKEAHIFYEKIGFSSSDKVAFVKTMDNEQSSINN